MTRLVHLAGYTPPQRGSFVPFLKSVLGAARERGWSAEAVFPAAARDRAWVPELRDAGIAVQLADGSRRELTGWLRDRFGSGPEPTILHTHFTLYDVPAALAARRHGNVSTYWHIHTVLSDRPRTVVANALKFGLFGRYVDRILTPSAGVAESVRRRLGDANKITVLPSPIDPDAFPVPSGSQRAQFREQLGVQQGRQALLHFGRHWHLKDGDIFLDALAVLLREGRPVVGLINQGGEEARSAAARRGLQEHVQLVGMLPDAKQLYGAADVLVAPSRGEGMPFTVVEALCSGIPVVASDLPGHRFLGDELAACTITRRDAGQIATAIADFLDMDARERARRCAAAREWIVERLDLSSAARRLIDEYERTLAGPQAASPR